MQGKETERPFGGLIYDLFQSEILLIRQEVELAKMEMDIKAGRAFKCFLFVAAGGGLVLSAFILLLQVIVFAVSRFFSPVTSRIAISAFVGGVGLLIMGVGIYKVSKQNITPGRSIEIMEPRVELGREAA